MESNVAHLSPCDHAQAGKVRRYIHSFVASELVSAVEAFILAKTHVATNNRLISWQRISALLPSASWEVSSGGSL